MVSEKNITQNYKSKNFKTQLIDNISEQHNIKIDESKPLKKEYDNSFNELDALDQY